MCVSRDAQLLETRTRALTLIRVFSYPRLFFMLRKIRVNKKRVEIRLKKKEGEKVAGFKITFEGKKSRY